jgi:photosystem II stability/assembly factor-like uncharacterized protein
MPERAEKKAKAEAAGSPEKQNAPSDRLDALRPRLKDSRQQANEVKPAPANEAVESARQLPAPAAAPAAQAMAKVAGGRPMAEVPSPDAATRWRISGTDLGSTVERTTDGGSTWQAQLTSGAIVSSGSSPAPSVCWLAGPGGTVLLTADAGATWLRVPLSETTDLTGIVAVDARSATVTTADGRRFTTVDGGHTWIGNR